MVKLVLFAPGLLLLALAAQSPAPAPQAAAAKPGADSLAHVKKVYGYDCAMCHGANGDGKGELVEDMKLTLKDYTDAASLKELSDTQIADIIKNGKGQMPGEGVRMKPDEVTSMVYLVRSFAKK